MHQRSGALTQDACGYWWCEHCSFQREVMSWGALHHFPSLQAEAYRIEQGKDSWVRFCQMEGDEAVRQLFASLPVQ